MTFPSILMAFATASLLLLSEQLWRRRKEFDTSWRFLLPAMLLTALWAAAAGIEDTTTAGPVKVMASQVSYLGVATTGVLWLLFVVSFVRQRRTPFPPVWQAVLWIEPVVILAAAWTNPSHGWLWSSITPYPDDPTGRFLYARGPLWWIHAAYSYLLMAASTLLLLRHASRTSHLFRKQALVLLLVALLPWVGNLVYLLRICPGCLDTTPLGFAGIGALLLWSISRHRFLDLVPIARDAVFLGMADGVLVLDDRGRLVDANPAARTKLELPRSFPGMLATTVIPWWEDMRQKVELANGKSVEYPVLAKGRQHWLDVRRSRIKAPDAQHAGVLYVLRDVTERKQEQELHARLQAHLNQAQRIESIGRLAGGIAHDFNNSLQSILGHTEMALEIAAEDHPLHEDLDAILKGAQRSASLTRQLLGFARRQPASPRVLDLNSTVESMLKMLRRLIGEDLELAWVPALESWPVKMDPSQIDHILANLCLNARDAIHLPSPRLGAPPRPNAPGRVTLATRKASFRDDDPTRPASVPSGDFMVLSITDNGCGMDSETLSHLFEPFFTTKGIGKGTGLGLATVYGIVRQNNGGISVESVEGIGTTFLIHLPRHRPTEVEQDQAALPPTAPLSPKNILLVEDEGGILDMVARTLRSQGHSVLAAPSPEEALRLASTTAPKPDLLMTDVVMPGMNGRDLSERIAVLVPGIRILFMSGYTADVISRHGVLDERVHFIGKPFDKQALEAKLQEVLGNKPQGECPEPAPLAPSHAEGPPTASSPR